MATKKVDTGSALVRIAVSMREFRDVQAESSNDIVKAIENLSDSMRGFVSPAVKAQPAMTESPSMKGLQDIEKLVQSQALANEKSFLSKTSDMIGGSLSKATESLTSSITGAAKTGSSFLTNAFNSEVPLVGQVFGKLTDTTKGLFDKLKGDKEDKSLDVQEEMLKALLEANKISKDEFDMYKKARIDALRDKGGTSGTSGKAMKANLVGMKDDKEDSNMPFVGFSIAGIKRMAKLILKATGIVGVIASAMYGLWDGWRSAEKIFGPGANIGQKISSAIGGLVNFFSFGFLSKDDVAKFLYNAGDTIVSGVQSFFGNIGGYITDGLQSLVDSIGLDVDMSSVLKTVTDSLLGIPGKIVDFVMTFPSSIETILANPPSTEDITKNIRDAISNLVTGISDYIINFASSLKDKVLGWFTGDSSNTSNKSDGKGFWSNVGDFFTGPSVDLNPPKSSPMPALAGAKTGDVLSKKMNEVRTNSVIVPDVGSVPVQPQVIAPSTTTNNYYTVTKERKKHRGL